MGEIDANPLSRWVLERKQAGVRQWAHSLLAGSPIHLGMLRIRILYVRFIPALAGAASLSSTCEQQLCPLREIFERETGCNLVAQPLTVQALTVFGLSPKLAGLRLSWIQKRLEGFPLRPLRPRYPWELPARRRLSTRHDEEDRFR
jgi:hypothetical protein